MNQTYAKGRQKDARAGGIILIVASCLATVLVIAGLIYAMGAGDRQQSALAAAGCEPGLSPADQPCITARMLTGQYMAVMTPASQQLNVDVAAYSDSETHNLAAAEAALTATVTTEQALDTGLASITFPPAVAAMVKALIRANQALATLTAEQARSSTLTQLRSFDDRVRAASATVQTQMKLILEALASPPQQS